MLGLSMGGGGYRRSKEDHMQLRKVSPGCLRSEFLDWFEKERKAISNVNMYHKDQGLYGQGVGCGLDVVFHGSTDTPALKSPTQSLAQEKQKVLGREYLSSSLSQTCGSLEFCKPVSLQLRPSGVGRQTFC